jgi:hypothetical protein
LWTREEGEDRMRMAAAGGKGTNLAGLLWPTDLGSKATLMPINITALPSVQLLDSWLSEVASAYNPGYSGGTDWEDRDPISPNKPSMVYALVISVTQEA